MSDPTKLGIYNDALQIVGDYQLNAITENVSFRYDLDAAWDFAGEENGCIEVLLELVKPRFATFVETLATGVTSAEHGYTKSYDLTSAISNDDFLTIAALYSDAKLDQRIDRYFITGQTLSCNVDPIYLRYVTGNLSGTTTSFTSNKLNDTGKSFTNRVTVGMTVYNTTDGTSALVTAVDSATQLTLDTDIMANGEDYQIIGFNLFTPSFTSALSAYLALKIANRYVPDRVSEIKAYYDECISKAIDIDGFQETNRRAKELSGTLDTYYLKLYNLSLMMLGEDKLTNGSDDSKARSYLDTAIDSGIVQGIFEDGTWMFASKTIKSESNPSISTDFAYEYVHDYPADYLSICGLFYDEYLRTPYKDYVDEADYIYADTDELYLQYMSTDYLTTPGVWPQVFHDYVAAKMAYYAMDLFDNVDKNRVIRFLNETRREAKSYDARNAPKQIVRGGSWVNSRVGRRYNESWSR